MAIDTRVSDTAGSPASVPEIASVHDAAATTDGAASFVAGIPPLIAPICHDAMIANGDAQRRSPRIDSGALYESVGDRLPGKSGPVKSTRFATHASATK